jgi:hypothetical protein
VIPISNGKWDNVNKKFYETPQLSPNTFKWAWKWAWKKDKIKIYLELIYINSLILYLINKFVLKSVIKILGKSVLKKNTVIPLPVSQGKGIIFNAKSSFIDKCFHV